MKIVSSKASPNDIAGFGKDVIKFSDSKTHEIIAYLGLNNQKIHITKPISPEQLNNLTDSIKNLNLKKIRN